MEMNSYGNLLISKIFDRIPNQLRIIISRNFKSDVWDLRNVTDIFKRKLFARERCYAIQKKKMQRITSLKTRFSLDTHCYLIHRKKKTQINPLIHNVPK